MKLILATLLALGASPALAQPYVGAFGGLSVPTTQHVDLTKSRLTAKFDDGYQVGATAGYDFGPVRAEIEGSYARMSANTVNGVDARGSYSRRSAMFNLLADLPMSSTVTGYAGGGVGVSDLQAGAYYGPNCQQPAALRVTSGANRPKAPGCTDQGKTGNAGFTWQAIAGLNFDAGRGWAVGPQFRYTQATDVRTATKTLRPNETRHLSSERYGTYSALVAVTKKF